MRRSALTVLAVALVAALAACGEEPAAEPAPDTPEPTEPTEPADDGAEPTPTPTPSPTPTADEPGEPDGEGADEVTVYYVREHDSGVWVEPEVVPLDEPTLGVARAAMEGLVGHDPRAPGRVTVAAGGAAVHGVDIDGDVLVVDFGGLVDGGLGAAYEQALVQQIAHTGAQFDGIRAVRILVDGEEVETLAGHVDVSAPVEPDPFAIAPITFTSHMTGDTIAVGDVTVAGEACTFEATVGLTLVAPDGSTEEAFTTASIACPERGEWEHTFTITEPGVWGIIATEPDPSAGEGRPPFETSVELEAS